MVKKIANSFPNIKVRDISTNTQIFLFAKSAGRCEICNILLVKDEVTQKNIIWGEKAHIHAFNPGGNRTKLTKLYLNTLDNLMLLCPNCHTKIDKPKQEEEYSIKWLQECKTKHEKKILLSTSAKSSNETKVLKVIANINTQTVKLSKNQIIKALMDEGLYSVEEKYEEIDFTNFDGLNNNTYWESKKEEIDNIIAKFQSDLRRNNLEHISVFAIGPMPLLMYLGSKLDDTVETKFFQKHRDGEHWLWNKGSAKTKYAMRKITEGHKNKIALLLSLSGFIEHDTIPTKILDGYTIYELFVDPNPNYNFLRTEKDLMNFQKEYATTISTIKNNHPNIKEIHIFPAVPAPIAIVCGRSLNKNSDPRLKVYNRSQKNNFVYALSIK